MTGVGSGVAGWCVAPGCSQPRPHYFRPPPEGEPRKGQEQHLKLGVSPALEAPFTVCSSLSSAIQLLKVNS